MNFMKKMRSKRKHVKFVTLLLRVTTNVEHPPHTHTPVLYSLTLLFLCSVPTYSANRTCSNKGNRNPFSGSGGDRVKEEKGQEKKIGNTEALMRILIRQLPTLR